MNEPDYTQLAKEIARLNGIIDVLLLQNRILMKEITVLKSGNAHSEKLSSVADFMKGRTENFSSVDKKVVGITNDPKALPPFIEVSFKVTGKLINELKALGMNKVKRIGLGHMAVIILRAHNKQLCSHTELRKHTGLSEGGIAKLIMSMKKRGLIYRDGFQRFALHATAKQLLAKAVGEG